jgi:hypothetical protein
MPIVASQFAVGVCGAYVLGGRVLVIRVANSVRAFKRFLADAAILDVPILVVLLGCQDGEVVIAEILINLIGTLLDVRQSSDVRMGGLVGRPDLANLVKNLVPIFHGPDHLVEAVGQDLMNCGGVFGDASV